MGGCSLRTYTDVLTLWPREPPHPVSVTAPLPHSVACPIEKIQPLGWYRRWENTHPPALSFAQNDAPMNPAASACSTLPASTEVPGGSCRRRRQRVAAPRPLHWHHWRDVARPIVDALPSRAVHGGCDAARGTSCQRLRWSRTSPPSWTCQFMLPFPWRRRRPGIA